MKKRVKFLSSIASNEFAYKPGDEAVLDAKVADAWAAAGICVVEENKKEK